MSLIYNMDNSITIDDQPSMSMESQVLSDAPCPTDSIRFTNKYKKYSSTQQTESHQGIHIEETIQNCSKYDQCFTQNGDLEIHQRIHIGEKTYKCSTCDKCFTRKTGLNMHRRIHTGEKPYTCSTCDK